MKTLLSEWSDIDTEIKKLLLEKGYKFLGAGVDQMAFLEPGTGYVYKIFGTKNTSVNGVKNSYFTEEQKGFILWAKFCMKNRNNIFLPRFYGMESFQHKGKIYLQIRQELLYEMPDSYAREFEYVTVRASATKKIPLSNFHKNILKKLFNFDDNTANYFYKTLQSLAKLARTHHYHPDLHSGNVMIRENNTPVINDPWVKMEYEYY